MMLGGEAGPDHGDGEPAGPVTISSGQSERRDRATFEADLLIAPHQFHKTAPTAGNRLKRHEIG